jgi:hypothetical protein
MEYQLLRVAAPVVVELVSVSTANSGGVAENEVEQLQLHIFVGLGQPVALLVQLQLVSVLHVYGLLARQADGPRVDAVLPDGVPAFATPSALRSANSCKIKIAFGLTEFGVVRLGGLKPRANPNSSHSLVTGT